MGAALLILMGLLVHTPAQAQNLGVVGQTYAIAEEDFLTYIEHKIESLKAKSEWQKLEEQFQQRVVSHLDRPSGQHLPRAQESKTYSYDPSFTAPYDVWDTQGHLIVKKDAVINPLERISLSSTLLFFDGEDKEQLAWAQRQSNKYKAVKFILTSGSIKSATHYFKQAVYFDLNGFLINKFHIKALPVKVQQQGSQLLIHEVKL
ncbi:MAG TPA: type-F conjugative transfer system protein TraW [Legionella sp.]|nr:type-F conjugative transfer system protein TraW [Legionella sp.]